MSVLYETLRLTVRKIFDADAQAMHSVYGDAVAMRWVGDGDPLDMSGCQHWIKITLQNYVIRGYGMSALEKRDTGEVVGFMGLVHPGGQEEAELKYALRQEYWGQGLATEAAIGMLEYCRKEFNLTYLIATVHPENTASQKVLLKAGMKKGELRSNGDGTFTQMFVWHPSEAS